MDHIWDLPKNNPRLLELVNVRVLRPFYVARQRLEVDTLVRLSRFDAESMQAIKKCEIVNE